MAGDAPINKYAKAIIHILDHLPKGAYFSVGRGDPNDIEYDGIGFWVQVLVNDRDGEQSPRDYGDGKTWREAFVNAGLLPKAAGQ